MEIQTDIGERIVAYTPTFPARRYWYRHDTVSIDGVRLDGHIQVKQIPWVKGVSRLETITCYKDSCVLGRQIDWLIRMNADKGVSLAS